MGKPETLVKPSCGAQRVTPVVPNPLMTATELAEFEQASRGLAEARAAWVASGSPPPTKRQEAFLDRMTGV
jgi:fructose-1-phosphate kinase PfkB-like protein